MLDETMETKVRKESDGHLVVVHGRMGDDEPLCEVHLGRGEAMQLARQLRELLGED